MTEIRGADYNISRQLMMKVIDVAKDGDISKDEIGELNKLAAADSSGLTDDEKKLIASLDINAGNPEIVKSNIAALQKLASEHSGDANVMSFAGLDLKTKESKWFGISSDLVSHGIQINDSNIPVINNSTTNTTMQDRNKLDQQNLVKMLAPLEQEINASPPSAELRDRVTRMLAENAKPPIQPEAVDAGAVDAKIADLKGKIEAYKSNPSENFRPMYDAYCELAVSYANHPPADSSPLGKGYFAALNGTMYTVLDTNLMALEEKKNLQNGVYQTPGSIDGINTKQTELSNAARQELKKSVDNADRLANALVKLQKDNPGEYEKVMGGFGVSDLDALRGKIETLKQSLAENKPITQAQLTQANDLCGSLVRVAYQSKLQDALQSDPQVLGAKRKELEASIAQAQADAASPDEATRTAGAAKEQELQAQLTALNSQTPVSEDVAAAARALDVAYTQAGESGTISKASEAVKALAQSTSSSIAELDQVKRQIGDLLKDPNLTTESRDVLFGQLKSIKTAQDAIASGQPVSFSDPDQAKSFNDVLGMVSALRTQKNGESGTPAAASNTFGPFLPDFKTDPFDLGGFGYGVGNFSLFNPASSFGSSVGSGIGNSFNASNGFNLDYSLTRTNPAQTTFFRQPMTGVMPPLALGTGGSTVAAPQGPPKTLEQLLRESISSTQSNSSAPASAEGPARPQGSAQVPSTVAPENIETYQSLLEMRALNVKDTKTTALLDVAMDQLKKNNFAANDPSLGSIRQLVSSYKQVKQEKGLEAGALSVKNVVNELIPGDYPSSADLRNTLADASFAGNFQNSVTACVKTEKFQKDLSDVVNASKNQTRDAQALVDQTAVPNSSISAIQSKLASGNPPWDTSKPISANFTKMSDADFNSTVTPELAKLNAEVQQTQAEFEDLQAKSISSRSAMTPEDTKRLQELTDKRTEQRQLSAAVELRGKTREAGQVIHNATTGLRAQISTLEKKNPLSPAEASVLKAMQAQLKVFETAEAELASTGRLSDSIIDQTSIATGLQRANFIMLKHLQANPNSPEFTGPNGAFTQYTNKLASGHFSMNDINALVLDTRSNPRLKHPQPGPKGTPSADLNPGEDINSVTTDMRTKLQGYSAAIDVTTSSANDPAGPFKRAFAERLRNPDSMAYKLAKRGVLPPQLQSVANEVLRLNPSGGSPAGGAPVGGAAGTAGNAATGNAVSAQTTGGAQDPDNDHDANAEIDRLIATVPSSAFTNVTSGGPTGGDAVGTVPGKASPAKSNADFLAMDVGGPAFANTPLSNVVKTMATENQTILALPPDQRAEALKTAISAAETMVEASNSMMQGMERITQELKTFNAAQTADAGKMLDTALAGYALDHGMTPQELGRIADKDPNLDADTLKAIHEADEMERNSDLAPMPAVSGEELFEKWLTETLGIIRNWDEATRKLIMAQIAKQMMDQVINTFYKDKSDESANYHNKKIGEIDAGSKSRIQANDAMANLGKASGGQSIASLSGSTKGSARGEAFNLEALRKDGVQGMRQQLAKQIQDARNGTPPLNITPTQERRLLAKFDAIIKAAGTEGIEDDRATVAAMRGNLAGMIPGLRPTSSNN